MVDDSQLIQNTPNFNITNLNQNYGMQPEVEIPVESTLAQYQLPMNTLVNNLDRLNLLETNSNNSLDNN